MAIAQFSKFSPGGNDTLFIHSHGASQKTCAEIFASLGGEQWGRADIPSRKLVMGGGEFCVNAARAFGALLDMETSGEKAAQAREYEMEISGWPGRITLAVSGASPDWRVAARLLLPSCPVVLVDKRHCLVHLPGIWHLLYFGGAAPFPENAGHIRDAEEKCQQFGLNGPGALGIVHCRQNASAFHILPYVKVPEAGTAMIEGACGSASLALALALFRERGIREITVGQPLSSLDVSLEETADGLLATVSGPVAFLMAGRFNTSRAQFSGGNKCAE